MSIIDKVLSREEFVDRPPVLIDIGASGAIHSKWRNIARYSVCIAFDADEREMGYAVRENSGFRKLYVFNCIVTDIPSNNTDFYLTESPFCSSTLEPDKEHLENWPFADLFTINKRVSLTSATISSVLGELEIDKIDWFKVDAQGTDLRLFKSLGDERIRRTLAAEFEPGILDAYLGEDKLWSLIAFMSGKPFWMSSLEVRGTQRISGKLVDERIGRAGWRWLSQLLTIAPGWAEVAYLRSFSEDSDYLELRDFLLGWIFATIEQHHTYALEIAVSGYQRFGDSLFIDLEREALSRVRRQYLRLPLLIFSRLPALVKRVFNRR